MSIRAPFQVMVLPFRLRSDGGVEYVALYRSDHHYWHGVSGGGEDQETPVEAARREAFEEAGLLAGEGLIPLQTRGSIPRSHFGSDVTWDASVYILPEHCFGLYCTDQDIVLSDEHTTFRWGSYDEIHALLRYDSNRTALWELDLRIQRCDQLPGVSPDRS